jgi:hypothetical protein
MSIPYLASKFTQENFKKMQINLYVVEYYTNSIEILDPDYNLH